MYKNDTILKLREQRKDFPYNRVRVIGRSPVSHAGAGSQWEGGNAEGVIIEPLDDFAGNLDEPYGKLVRLYEIESEPDPIVQTVTTITHVDPTSGQSPEDVFAEEAAQAGKDDGRSKRSRAKKQSPLGEDAPADPSPLTESSGDE